MHKRRVTVMALGLCAGASAADAATLANLGLTREQVSALNAQLTAPVSAPGIAFGSPVAFGAGWGQAYAGIGGQTTPPGATDDVDGSAFVGFGLGDPVGFIGLDYSATFISVQEDFAEDGAFNAKVHSAMPFGGAMAIGVEGAEGWGAAEDVEPSVYAVYTQIATLTGEGARRPVKLAVNVGVGDGRFTDARDEVGVFGSLALVPARPLSITLDWNGLDASAGLSVVPLFRVPLVVTVGAVNLTERFGRDVEFAGGIGYLFQF